MVYTQITPQRMADYLRIGIITLIILHSGSGELEIRRVDSPVEVRPGHNTTLPCLFYGYKTPLDLSMVSVRWIVRTLEGQERQVYWFGGGKRIQNRPGSYIPDRGLMGGNGSLYIPNIQSSDDGEYTCTVIVTPEKATSEVTMRVLAVPNCTLSDSTLEMYLDTEGSVTCYVNGFYPEHVIIHWVKYSRISSSKSELYSQTNTSIPVRNRDGTYNVTSVLTVRPTSTLESGDLYSCVIHHWSLKDEGLTCNATMYIEDGKLLRIILNVFANIVCIPIVLGSFAYGIYKYIKSWKAPPKVFNVLGPPILNHGKKTTLSFRVKGFTPNSISFFLYLNKVNEENLVDSWTNKKTEDILLRNLSLMLDPRIRPDNHVFDCDCSISITADLHKHNGANLILEVRHEALKDPIFKWRRLRVIAEPVLNPIKANQESYNVGDHLELTCRIHSFHPQYINVIWYKGKKTLPSINSGARKAKNGFIYVTSLVRVTVTEEDFGKKFKCKAEHLGSPDRRVTWRLQRNAEPVLDPIEANQESYNVGDHLELTCRIHSFHPQNINVTWYKGEETLPSINSGARKSKNGLFYVTSSVRVTVIEEDFGEIFRCKVEHPGTPDNDEGVTWTLQRQSD